MIQTKLLKQFVLAQGGKFAPQPTTEEELDPSIQYDQAPATEPIESMDSIKRIDFSRTQDSHCSGFSFFEDGRQRTLQISHIHRQIGDYHVTIPIHLCVVAAVILQRQGKNLKVWRRHRIKKCILVAKSLLPDQNALDLLNGSELDLIDTEKVNRESEGAGDYYDLKRRALRLAKSLRLDLEQDLISEWRESSESKEAFLVVDGTLMNLRNERNVDRCVGVSKSFGTRFSSVSDYNRVMKMKEFERSWTFRFHNPEDEDYDLRKGPRERVSWYLRLRDGNNKEPEFGLVRIEISKKYIEESSQYADCFSKWLLSERLPTCYPEPRWDKHLYPISECEKYLSSVMPSTETINASMRG